MNYRNKIIQGDCLEKLKLLPDGIIDTCVTSPPYWGLRDYAVDGQMGLEETPEEFIGAMVEVFREVRRVMKPSGVCWINIGDSYSSGASGNNMQNAAVQALAGSVGLPGEGERKKNGSIFRKPLKHDVIKPKDLVGIPWMLAFALRADGWYLRQDIIWQKPNPMPESVNDRCTKSHEYIFMLTKSRNYYYDAHAIKEKVSEGNKRSVWTVATRSFSEAHFATFPERLIIDCIKAGSSEHGCCAVCGAPYERILEPSARYAEILGSGYHDHEDDLGMGMAQTNGTNIQNKMRDAGITSAEYETKGWKKTCECAGDVIQPAVVLDPFGGAGTTPLVTRKCARDFLVIELNQEYISIMERRLKKELGMFL